MQQKNNTPEEEAKLTGEEEGTQGNNPSGKKIIEGARQEDQLGKLKESVPEGGRNAYPKRHAGTPPGEYDPHDKA